MRTFWKYIWVWFYATNFIISLCLLLFTSWAGDLLGLAVLSFCTAAMWIGMQWELREIEAKDQWYRRFGKDQ